MSTITWLHLSDLHFTSSDLCKWDANIVLQQLVEDVKDRIDKDNLRLDFIIVSGDIAFKSAREEYALAEQFFNDLLESTDVPKKRLFIVPGNHDIDRNAITSIDKTILSSLTNRKEIVSFLNSVCPKSRQIC